MEEALSTKREEEESGACTDRNEPKAEVLLSNMRRKEKRKAMKKMKRKQTRKEVAAKQREEEVERLNDPEEQRRIQLLEQEELERIERERKEFEERERAWLEALEMRKKKEAAEEEQRKLLEESLKQQQEDNGLNQDGEWEYVEEGPAEIIWQGNEIIFKKKKVRVPKKNLGQQNKNEDADRPISNPLPPESEFFAEYTNASTVSAQQMLENVAQQVPNFGTEQDKAHCPFHLKTGACRFGQRCSRVHFYPDKSCTLLMKNMYNGPGLAWEQDEGLEHTDEEIERCFEEFYEDVHTEFLKFGEIVNFKVCKNGSFHLRGNVYVQYKSLDSALLAYNSVNGRYFAGKQVRCEFVNLTRWKVAICGEFMKSGFKSCSHGTACNFIHCFRNPGGDYEWADSDKPPPKYWVKKMVALFGYSADYENRMDQENLSVLKKASKMSKTDSDGYHSRRSRSRDMDKLNNGCSGRRRHEDGRKTRTPDEEIWEQNADFKDNYNKRKGRTSDIGSDREWLHKDEDREKNHKRTRKGSSNRNKDEKSRGHEEDSDVGHATIPRDRERQHDRKRRISKQWNEDSRDKIYEAGSDGDRSDRGRGGKMHCSSKRKSSRHQSRDNSKVNSETESDKALFDRGDIGTQHDLCRKSLAHSRYDFQDDYKDYENEIDEVDGGWSEREFNRRAHHHHKRKSSRHRNKLKYYDDHRDTKDASPENRGERSDNDFQGETEHKSKRLSILDS